MKKGLPIEGVSLEEARAIKASVSDPGAQHRRLSDRLLRPRGIASGAFDGVAIARSLVANNDLVRQWQSGRDLPERPCTYCNKCLLNAPKNPMGCYELARFPSREAMIDESDDDLRHARDAEPAAGSSLGRSMPWPPNRPSPTSKRQLTPTAAPAPARCDRARAVAV